MRLLRPLRRDARRGGGRTESQRTKSSVNGGGVARGEGQTGARRWRVSEGRDRRGEVGFGLQRRVSRQESAREAVFATAENDALAWRRRQGRRGLGGHLAPGHGVRHRPRRDAGRGGALRPQRKFQRQHGKEVRRGSLDGQRGSTERYGAEGLEERRWPGGLTLWAKAEGPGRAAGGNVTSAD